MQFSINFIQNSSVGGQSWMIYLLILLLLRRLCGWKQLLRRVNFFEVVRALNGDKAMGHDGFSVAFFQICWKVPREDIMNVF